MIIKTCYKLETFVSLMLHVASAVFFDRFLARPCSNAIGGGKPDSARRMSTRCPCFSILPVTMVIFGW